MECNNQHCVFCMFDQCCHESEEGFDKATPNELDCPSSVRLDLQYGLEYTQDCIMDLAEGMSMFEKQTLLTLIENQRPDGDKRDETLTEYINIFQLTNRRNLRELLDIKSYAEKLSKPWHVEIDLGRGNLRSVSIVNAPPRSIGEEDNE